MTELKTLKDMEGTIQWNKNPKVKTGDVSVNLLRQGAIKDIKELQKIEEIDMTKISVEERIKIEKKYFTLFDAVGAYDNSNVIDYIKWKNNITKEDLKGGNEK